LIPWYERRGFVASIEVLYLLVLFALALLYLTPWGAPLHLPDSFGNLPVGVPWFGALGAVITSLSGAFDHRTDWDPSWTIWHLTRPLIGISLAIIAWLTFQAGILAVGSLPSQTQGVVAPPNLLYYLIAFVVGYREKVFRELIKRVSDVILMPSPPSSGAAPVIAKLDPANGKTAGGETVTIIGSNLTGTTAVAFGGQPASNVRVASDGEVACNTPPRDAGPCNVTLKTSGGTATAGPFTYDA
jgi:hypothetical protein